MNESNLKRATEIFYEIDRIREKLEDAMRMAPSLCIKYMMEPAPATDGHGNTRVIDEIDVATLLGLFTDEVRLGTSKLIIGLLEGKIAELRKALKKLGVRLEDEEKPQKSAKLLQLPAPVRKKGEAA